MTAQQLQKITLNLHNMFPFGMKLAEKEDHLEKDLGVKDRLKQLQMVSKSH